MSLDSCTKQYVVVGQPELICQIEAEGELQYKFVTAKHKSFGGPQPMINKGKITGLYVENKKIELIDGQIQDGFVATKDYGKFRIIGIENPVYLWVTPKQKEKLLQLK